MKIKNKEWMKEILVRKNQFIQRHVSEPQRLGLRLFLSLPRKTQYWLTKKALKKGLRKKWEEMGRA